MGTPKKKHNSKRELLSPVIAEKIRLLETGKVVSRELKVNGFPDVLEGVRDILLPLVSWLDKPIYPEIASRNYSASQRFLKTRGIRLFKSIVMNIWLERSGMWFLEIHGSNCPKFQEVNSQRLAKIILQKPDNFLDWSFRKENLLKEASFLKDVAIYDEVIVQFVSQCFESVKVLVEAREKRLFIIKEWLNLLHEFGQSLDPLIVQGKEVSMKEYSIFRDPDDIRINRRTADYLCSKALNPFWELLRGRPEYEEYRKNVDEVSFDSLKDLLEHIDHIFREIEEADENTDAKSLSGHTTARLPLIKEEIEVLRKLIGSITA